VRAVGWRGGSNDERSPAGYGIKFTPADRDRHFDPAWTSVVLELADGPTVEVPLTDSFWRSCSELRSAELGRWLLASGRAPWPKHAPPGIAVNPIVNNLFSARILEWSFGNRPDAGDTSTSPSETMAALGIVQEGDAILREVARSFDLPAEAEDARRVIAQLASTMERVEKVHTFGKGVGIAAPQIGIGRAVALVRTPDGETITLITPGSSRRPPAMSSTRAASASSTCAAW
jgi:hypothetical protein